MSVKGKIINDPVYGFLRFPEPLLINIIDHPWFQRLRNIKQMGMAYLVYPGATHSRFQHSMGACYLMKKAIEELRIKDIEITDEEALAAQIAILLHDIGHGPYSHALEHTLVEGVKHERLSHLIMQQMNKELDGKLSLAIDIFKQAHPKKYLNQLVSSQLDVDRMDYLNRDSFFTGVSEGVIGYDRILQMLTVRDNELMVEEKGVHSVEKFIIARRLMYWQVYLHKTVLGSEMLLINILKRAKALASQGAELFATPSLSYFLYNKVTGSDLENDIEKLSLYCSLDDNDILTSIKVWATHEDKILSRLCNMILKRKLYKVLLSSKDISEQLVQKRTELQEGLSLTNEELDYYVIAGTTTNNTYNINDERIQIALKDGSTKDISEIDNPIVNKVLAMPVQKNYICYIQPHL